MKIIKVLKNNTHYQQIVKVQCDCGKEFSSLKYNIQNGPTKSCGCLRGKLQRGKAKHHGHWINGKPSTEYIIWTDMKQRCYNKNSPNYKNYGGRGIHVYEPWRISFIKFLNDMGNRPNKQMTLDRIDVNMHYTPWNCRWATWKEQMSNKRKKIFL